MATTKVAKRTPRKSASAKTVQAATPLPSSIAPVPPAAPASPDAIKIRMYRQGLGDCFLITLPGANGPFYIVIDCGVVLGADAKGIDTLTNAVKNISDVTKSVTSETTKATSTF